MILESIQTYCSQQNFAGNTHIQCVPVGWIENYPEFAKDGHNFSQAIDLKVGRNWLVFPCVPDTLDFRERERVGAHGPVATPTISGFLPNDTPKIAGILNASKANEWVVILYYKTGAAKVIGSPDYPARFSSSLTNRGSLNSGKGYDIEFYSEGDFKTFFLDELPEVVDAVCLPATVTNGANYTGTVASGDVLLLPNENITVNGSLLVNKPSVEDFDVEVVDSNDNAVGVISGGKVVVSGGVKEGIAYLEPNAHNFAPVSYADGDDRWRWENGVYIRPQPESPLYFQQMDGDALDPINTLKHPNIFGNYLRFTRDDGSAVTSVADGVDYYDHLTGRIFYIDKNNSFVNWSSSCSRFLEEGWHLPSLEEYTTLKRQVTNGVLYINNISVNTFLGSSRFPFTCNTLADDSERTFRLSADGQFFERALKTSSYRSKLLVKLIP